MQFPPCQLTQCIPLMSLSSCSRLFSNQSRRASPLLTIYVIYLLALTPLFIYLFIYLYMASVVISFLSNFFHLMLLSALEYLLVKLLKLNTSCRQLLWRKNTSIHIFCFDVPKKCNYLSWDDDIYIYLLLSYCHYFKTWEQTPHQSEPRPSTLKPRSPFFLLYTVRHDRYGNGELGTRKFQYLDKYRLILYIYNIDCMWL